MSPLTTVALPFEDVPLSDGGVQRVRSLSWAEAYRFDEVKPGGDSKLVALIAFTTESTEEEVRAWIAATPSQDIGAVSAAASRVSKLGPSPEEAERGEAEGEASRAPSSGKKRTPSRTSSPRSSG